jgi:hypothetical protein
MKGLIPTDRPAELTALLAIAGAVFAWLTERGVPVVVAALVGLAAGAVPLAVSVFRDSRDPDPDAPPPADVDEAINLAAATIGTQHERAGLDHAHERNHAS